MKRILITLILLLLIGCKKDKQNNEDIEVMVPLTEEEAIDESVFKLIINMRIREDDKIQFFYNDESTDGSFSPDKRFAANVKGSDMFQEITFSLPEMIIPYKFRIDLGENNIETLVEINEIKLQYADNSILIDRIVLNRFFQPNIYLEKTENGYLRKMIKKRYDPFLVSTALLIKKMELEL